MKTAVSDRFMLKRKEPKKDATLDRLSGWYEDSAALKSTYEDRWEKNLKLSLGIPTQPGTVSKVRGVEKIFFRKIWAIKKRLVASMHSAFMSDPNCIKIEGRDKFNDFFKAAILSEIVEYRKDRMMNTRSLAIKHSYAFEDILDYGFCVGRFMWDYDPENGIDEPDYIVWPPEQYFPDMHAETPDKIRYHIFVSYMTREEMEEAGYKNIDECSPEGVEESGVRAVRHNIHRDPKTNYSDNSYLPPGVAGDIDEQTKREVYRVHECFWKEGKKWKFAVTNGDDVYLVEPMDNPYGDFVPVVLGFCLTVPHRLIGEGIAEPLEGPQESYNFNLNIRKDNVALCLNAPTLVNRMANVDLASLVNIRSGGVVLADDTTEMGVRKLNMGDVTQSSYAEATADDMMMQEMSGVTAAKLGMERADKATVAQINFQESNEKINLYLSIAGETYWRAWHYILAKLIQRFETDEAVFRIANTSFAVKENLPFIPNIDMVDDFDADIKVTFSTQGRPGELQNTMLLMDRSIMYNQQLMGLIQAGVIPVQNAKFVNLTGILEDVLPLLGKRSLRKYFISAQPPTAPPQTDKMNEGLQGRITPQIGNTDIGAQANPYDLKIQGTPNMQAAY